jgi:hypothetical protein
MPSHLRDDRVTDRDEVVRSRDVVLDDAELADLEMQDEAARLISEAKSNKRKRNACSSQAVDTEAVRLHQ